MIAYNHHIEFIPELKNDKKVEGSFVDVITVKEISYFEFEDKLLYEITFINNQGRDNYLRTDRDFLTTRKEQPWEFEVKDVVKFFWYSGSLKIEYIPQKEFSFQLLEYWLLHIILPMYFTVEEKYDFLHAGAVEVENKPILFTAESFGGKSTMTDFFLKQGHTLISDDKVATIKIDNQIYAISSHPHHRPYRKMEDLGYFVKDFSVLPKAIHAIYELKKGEPNSKIIIEELSGVEKFKSLQYASEMNLFFQKQKRFTYLTKMAKSVPVFKVTIPWKIDRLKEVYMHILQHIKYET